MFKRRIQIVCLLMLLVFVSAVLAGPKNIVLFIGDGMGFEQVKAAGFYAKGREGTFVFESFPYKTEMTTYSADAAVTDSAAAATAIATGRKVNNGVISQALPGDGQDLVTLLEIFKQRGKSVGLVTTTYITHATPAAFGAHQPKRGNLAEIAADYLNQTRPNVFFGAGAHGITPALAIRAGYIVLEDADALKELDTEKVSMVCGLFGSDIPYEYDGLGLLPGLSDMTETALKILDNDPDGFFLMVEGGKIDWAGHANHLGRNMGETIEFAQSVKVVHDWAWWHLWRDTLIVVTADHETGGLKVLQNNGKGKLPDVDWTTGNHTAANVPVYAWGVGAKLFTSPMDNTDIFKKILTAAKDNK